MGEIYDVQETTEPKKVQIYLQGDLMAIKKSNFACVYMPNISQYDPGERCGSWASYFFFYQNSCRQRGKSVHAM
jgi:hypothetical protein